ncbi:Tn3 family transposase, partial [Streptomyces anulatus]|uniref:Tn3 family transposase n=1 Tax=Streptomyces anulatus TaxID=1892 RepID=UPI00341B8A2A
MPGAEALWGNLVGLLRPAWKRLLFGQSHLVFEYVFGSGGVNIRLWGPGVIPQHMVEHAVEAAWPSARTAVQEAAPPVPLAGQSFGGQLWIARSERLPIRYKHDTDPVRALVGAAVGMPVWQHAAVQILARPATGRRLAHVIRSGPMGAVRAALDLLTPGPLHARLHPPQHLRQHADDRAARLEEAADARAIRDKAHQFRYAVAIRYVVQAGESTSTDVKAVNTAHAARRNAIRGRAHALASAFALYSGHNRLERHRLFMKGELYHRYERGLENQLGALGPVLNCATLWTTVYLDAAVRRLKAQGYPAREEDMARLSSFVHSHQGVHG